MEVNRLLNDEITYELYIRQLSTTGTVMEKRSTLRQALRAEKSGMTAAPSTTRINPENELAICETKLQELREAVRQFDVGNRENEFNRIYSRLVHVTKRLERIDRGDEVQLAHREDLISLSIQMIGRANLAYEGIGMSPNTQVSRRDTGSNAQVSVEQASILDEPNPILPEVVMVEPSTSRVVYDLVDIPGHNQVPDSQHLALLEEPVESLRASQAVAASSTRYPEQATSFQEGSRFQPVGRGSLFEIRPSGVPQADTGDPRIRQETPAFTPHEQPRDPDRSRSQVWFQNPTYVPEVSAPRNDFSVYANPSANSSIDFTSRLQPLHYSPVANTTTYVPYHRWDTVKLCDVSRWNVKYDGVSSVNDFVERIEELRRSRGVSKEQLLRSAPELFTKHALLWYRCGDFTSWDDLVHQLRADFQPYDYENSLWDEIRKRTQGSQEKVINFVAAMENLFNRLTSKPTEETRLQIIRRNLLPHIQTQLAVHSIYSLSELVRLSRSVEETETRVQRFCPPPTNYRYLVEPGLAYHRPSGSQPVAALDMEGGAPVRENFKINSRR